MGKKKLINNEYMPSIIKFILSRLISKTIFTLSYMDACTYLTRQPEDNPYLKTTSKSTMISVFLCEYINIYIHTCIFSSAYYPICIFSSKLPKSPVNIFC